MGQTRDQRRRKQYRQSKSAKVAQRSRNLRHRYGLTSDDFNRMLVEQEGCCAICRKHWSAFDQSLTVDHSHVTGKVRGLLCTGCNIKLGSPKHEQFIGKAAAYLRYHK